jgi:hypothetical protein
MRGNGDKRKAVMTLTLEGFFGADQWGGEAKGGGVGIRQVQGSPLVEHC